MGAGAALLLVMFSAGSKGCDGKDAGMLGLSVTPVVIVAAVLASALVGAARAIARKAARWDEVLHLLKQGSVWLLFTVVVNALLGADGAKWGRDPWGTARNAWEMLTMAPIIAATSVPLILVFFGVYWRVVVALERRGLDLLRKWRFSAVMGIHHVLCWIAVASGS